MARNCGCGGATCGCAVTGGTGITVTGIGTSGDPYIISAILARLSTAIVFQDTSSVNFTAVGDGTPSDIMTVTAVVTPVPFPPYTTAARPSAVASGIGAFYYDTTLGLPAWSNGTNWRNAAGTTV